MLLQYRPYGPSTYTHPGHRSASRVMAWNLRKEAGGPGSPDRFSENIQISRAAFAYILIPFVDIKGIQDAKVRNSLIFFGQALLGRRKV